MAVLRSGRDASDDDDAATVDSTKTTATSESARSQRWKKRHDKNKISEGTQNQQHKTDNFLGQFVQQATKEGPPPRIAFPMSSIQEINTEGGGAPPSPMQGPTTAAGPGGAAAAAPQNEGIPAAAGVGAGRGETAQIPAATSQPIQGLSAATEAVDATREETAATSQPIHDPLAAAEAVGTTAAAAAATSHTLTEGAGGGTLPNGLVAIPTNLAEEKRRSPSPFATTTASGSVGAAAAPQNEFIPAAVAAAATSHTLTEGAGGGTTFQPIQGLPAAAEAMNATTAASAAATSQSIQDPRAAAEAVETAATAAATSQSIHDPTAAAEAVEAAAAAAAAATSHNLTESDSHATGRTQSLWDVMRKHCQNAFRILLHDIPPYTSVEDLLDTLREDGFVPNNTMILANNVEENVASCHLCQYGDLVSSSVYFGDYPTHAVWICKSENAFNVLSQSLHSNGIKGLDNYEIYNFFRANSEDMNRINIIPHIEAVENPSELAKYWKKKCPQNAGVDLYECIRTRNETALCTWINTYMVDR